MDSLMMNRELRLAVFSVVGTFNRRDPDASLLSPCFIARTAMPWACRQNARSQRSRESLLDSCGHSVDLDRSAQRFVAT